jgi:hypothetical protein
MDWDAYEPYEGTDRPYDELPRDEARAHYNRLMTEKRARIDSLRRLLAANGLELSTDDKHLRELDEWFRANVEADPYDRSRSSSLWLSVCVDLGLFIGDAIIEREPGVRWHFFVGKRLWGRRHIADQRPVLVGFDVPNPQYVVDPLRLVYDYAFRIIQGGSASESDTLGRIVRG